MATTTPCILCTKQTDSKIWRPIHSEANRDVFMMLTAMVIEMFGSTSGDTIFPTGRVLCKTCHSSVQSIPKLEKKLLDLNQPIREQLRHAGLPYGLTRLPRQERQSVEAPTCTTPPADSSKGIGGSKRSNDTRDPPAKRRCLPFNHSSPKPGSSMNPMIASNGSPVSLFLNVVY